MDETGTHDILEESPSSEDHEHTSIIDNSAVEASEISSNHTVPNEPISRETAAQDPRRPPDQQYHDDAAMRADLLQQLERELMKRRPDHFQLCRLCDQLHGIPSEFRSTVWKEVLGITRTSERNALYLDQSIARVEEDLANQKVIQADALRTRRHDPFFQQPEITDMVVKILTYYCKCRQIRYKQGMNEVLAPLMMLETAPPLPESVIFQLFYALIDKLLPQTFQDKEFKSLQCSLQLYRSLLLYHDPGLCHYLEQHSMTPELYVTPWFMTLFARNTTRDVVFCLWDVLLLHPDAYLMHYVAVALVMSNKSMIQAADPTHLPQVLTSLTLETPLQVQALCHQAMELVKTTPRSFQRDLYCVCYGGFSETMGPLMRQWTTSTCIGIYAEELIQNLIQRCGNQTNASTSLSFIVLDCRPVDQYHDTHLSLSYHIDPEVVTSPEALAVLINGFSHMKGCHFCFVGPSEQHVVTSSSSALKAGITRLTRGISGEKQAPEAEVSDNEASGLQLYQEDISVTRYVLMFLQKGFEHVSRLHGGFEHLKHEILKMDAFVSEQLMVTAESTTNPTASGFSLKKAASDWIEKVRSSELEATSPPSIKEKTKATVSSLSQRLQTLTAAAKDAVAITQPQSPMNRMRRSSSVTKHAEAKQLMDEQEWLQVCLQTREALEKSLTYKDVVFEAGSLGILFHKAPPTKKKRLRPFLAMVDSIVPDSQASISQQIERGDLLVAINGDVLADVPFLSVIERIKDTPRPMVLRFLTNQKTKPSIEALDTIAKPPLPPTLVYATQHSLCITWPKPSQTMDNVHYQLQYARQSDVEFHPWLPVPLKSSEEDPCRLVFNSGTMVGLDPNQSFVFRVRYGHGERWGPYSLSSNAMLTTTTNSNEKNDQEPQTPVFLPGECPEFAERGEFFYRVIIALRARTRPAMDAEKLDQIVLERGRVIKCCERLVVPSTNQVFVRLVDQLTDPDPLIATDQLDQGIWAFENTMDGAVVLERLAGEEEYERLRRQQEEPSVPLQQQAKALMSSIFSSGSTTRSKDKAVVETGEASTLSQPQILQVFATSPSSIIVTWDPVNDSGVTKYQIQYAKNRFGAIWRNDKSNDIDASTLKHTVTDLVANTSYLFRVRGGNDETGWGPYSDPSEAIKTLALDETDELQDESTPPTSSASTAPSSTSSNTSNPLPLRTGSTLLDKAVAVASRLTLVRRRSASGATQSAPDETTEQPSVESSETVPAASTGINVEDFMETTDDHTIFRLEDWQVAMQAATVPVDCIPAKKIMENDESVARELLITSTMFLCLDTTGPQVTVEERRELAYLSKITRRKALSNSIVFHFRSAVDSETLDQLCFVVEDVDHVVALVRTNYRHQVVK